MLEASDAKVSSTVLRVLGDRKVAWLLADLPLTIRRDSSRPTDKPEYTVRRSVASALG